MKNEVIALCSSDWHIWQTPPVARAAEPDWWAAQARPLDEICKLQQKYDCPVFLAGDVFHAHNPNPECINFLLEHMPQKTYAIPGQHDLPNHRMADIKRSAYWTLVKAGAIEHVEHAYAYTPLCYGRLEIYGCPWGLEIPKPKPKGFGNNLRVLMIHKFLWTTPRTAYTGAPEEGCVIGSKSFEGFDVVVSGDNHQFFAHLGPNGPFIFNAGSLMRRNSDQVEHHPCIGLLHADGGVETHWLDCSADVINANTVEAIASTPGLEDFVNSLQDIHATELDFQSAIERAIRKLSPSENVRRLLLGALEKKGSAK